MIKGILKALYERLPPRVQGAMDYWSKHQPFFSPNSGPMNGQSRRLEAVADILQRVKVQEIIETGTFRGQTTEYLARFGVPVITVEYSLRFWEFARRRLRRFPNVRVYQGDSAEFLSEHLAAGASGAETRFFYLDAHWYDKLPLALELKAIQEHCHSAIVLIDDFAVPGDSDYGYDDYGPGKTLNIDLLRTLNIPNATVMFPVAGANEETGRRRGWVVVALGTETGRALAKSPYLRTYKAWSEAL